MTCRGDNRPMPGPKPSTTRGEPVHTGRPIGPGARSSGAMYVGGVCCAVLLLYLNLYVRDIVLIVQG